LVTGKEPGAVGAVHVTVAESSPAVAVTLPGAEGGIGAGGFGSAQAGGAHVPTTPQPPTPLTEISAPAAGLPAMDVMVM
jgi:hypothetical protein